MDMGPEDIQKELDRVWKRLTEESPSAGGQAPLSEPRVAEDVSRLTREAADEALALVRRRGRAEAARMEQLLDLRERTAAELREGLRAAQKELSELRLSALREGEAICEKIQEVSLELEAARDALTAERVRFSQEETLLRSVAEETRRELGTQAQRFQEEQFRWRDLEKALSSETDECKRAAARARDEAAAAKAETGRVQAALKDSKEALESTLGELLLERQGRLEAARRLAELEALWEKEREAWKGLCDRAASPLKLPPNK